jgi:hypothetical protein
MTPSSFIRGWTGIKKTGQASHIKTGTRRAASSVPMGSLTIPMEFLRPTGLAFVQVIKKLAA